MHYTAEETRKARWSKSPQTKHKNVASLNDLPTSKQRGKSCFSRVPSMLLPMVGCYFPLRALQKRKKYIVR